MYTLKVNKINFVLGDKQFSRENIKINEMQLKDNKETLVIILEETEPANDG